MSNTDQDPPAASDTSLQNSTKFKTHPTFLRSAKPAPQTLTITPAVWYAPVFDDAEEHRSQNPRKSNWNKGWFSLPNQNTVRTYSPPPMQLYLVFGMDSASGPKDTKSAGGAGQSGRCGLPPASLPAFHLPAFSTFGAHLQATQNQMRSG